jgi:hypothetical protein
MKAFLDKEQTRRPYKTAQSYYASPLNDWYPIPTAEIDASIVDGVKRLTQNTGW